MKHSHLGRVTRLSHPKAFEFLFGFRLGYAESPAHPEVDLNLNFKKKFPKMQNPAKLRIIPLL
jgi:hypothetical protein